MFILLGWSSDISPSHLRRSAAPRSHHRREESAVNEDDIILYYGVCVSSKHRVRRPPSEY